MAIVLPDVFIAQHDLRLYVKCFFFGFSVASNVVFFSFMSLAEFTLFLGVLLYLVGFPTILADEKVFHWRRKLLQDDIRIRLLGGLMSALAVLVLAKEYWVDFTVRGFMTFIVWMTLIKGLVCAWWPSKLQELSIWTEHKVFLDAPSRITLGVLQISIAALFTYWGFFVL